MYTAGTDRKKEPDLEFRRAAEINQLAVRKNGVDLEGECEIGEGKLGGERRTMREKERGTE